MSTIIIDLRSDTSETEAALTRVTSKLAGLKTGLGKVDTASKKATGGTDKLKTGVDGLKKVAAGTNGPLSSMVNAFADIGEGATQLAGVVGPTGVLALGLAAAAAGVVAIGAGAFMAISKLASFSEELLKTGDITGKQAASFSTFSSNVETLTTNMKLLAVLGFGPVVESIVAFVSAIGTGVSTIISFEDALTLVGVAAKATAYLLGGPLFIAYDLLRDKTDELTFSTLGYIDSLDKFGLLTSKEKIFKRFTDTIIALGAAQAEQEAAGRDHNAAQAEFIEFAERAAVIRDKSLAALEREPPAIKKVIKSIKKQTEAVVEQLSWVDLLNQKLERQKEVTDELALSEKTAAEERKNALNFEESKTASIAAIQKNMIEQRLVGTAMLSSALADFTQNALASAEQIATNAIKNEKKRAAVIKGIRIAAFIAEKAAALGQVVMNTAMGITSALSNPLTIPLVPFIQAAGIFQGAAIAAQPIPQFPHGGIVPSSVLAADHGLISAQPGEGVVNKRGMRNIGKDGLDNLNNGSSQGNMITVQNVYKHRVFDSFVQDNIRKGGPLSDALSTRKVGQTQR